jgi:hypothetical protein
VPTAGRPSASKRNKRNPPVADEVDGSGVRRIGALKIPSGLILHVVACWVAALNDLAGKVSFEGNAQTLAAYLTAPDKARLPIS